MISPPRKGARPVIGTILVGVVFVVLIVLVVLAVTELWLALAALVP